jgi:CubicO group peptidase (beta-lactamase class C family)
MSSKTRQALIGAAVLVAVLVLGCSRIGPAPREPVPTTTWQAISPAETCWSDERLEQARAHAERIGSGPVMVVVNGRVLAEWGETDQKFQVASVRKSLLSALIGLHVRTGEIDLTSTLSQLGIDDDPPSLTPAEQQATVGDLLTSRSGVYRIAEFEVPGMGFNRPARGSHAPGSWYYYNNWDFNALGTIFEQRTETKIGDAFLEEIAGPLQMQDFQATDVGSVTTGKSRHAAYPFRMSARDMARFGLLYLRRGAWDGKQVVPAEWVAESTALHVKGISATTLGQMDERAVGDAGYGYMWWVETERRLYPGVTLPAGSFAAQGNGGRYILVIPAYDLVIVHRGAGDEPGARGVERGEFGRLVRLLFDAAGVSETDQSSPAARCANRR